MKPFQKFLALNISGSLLSVSVTFLHLNFSSQYIVLSVSTQLTFSRIHERKNKILISLLLQFPCSQHHRPPPKKKQLLLLFLVLQPPTETWGILSIQRLCLLCAEGFQSEEREGNFIQRHQGIKTLDLFGTLLAGHCGQ